MSRLDDAIRNTNWDDFRAACVGFDENSALMQWIKTITDAAIADRLVTEDDVTGLKDYTVTETFYFRYNIKARDKAHADLVYEKMVDSACCPKYTIRVDGIRDEIEGEHENTRIEQGRAW